MDKAIAVRFDNGRAIPLESVFTYSDAEGYRTHPSEIIWADGSYSYAKGWWNDRAGLRLVRVGAGAYGNMDILQRDLSEAA